MSTIVTNISKDYSATLDALARAFGASGWTLKKSACRGKWSGTFDYCLYFSDGRVLFLGNGHANAKEGARAQLDQIEYFNFHAEENAQKCAPVIRTIFPGAENIRFEVVPYDGQRDLILWACLTFTVDGVKLIYRETGLHYSMIGAPYDGRSPDQRLANDLDYVKTHLIAA